MSDHVNRAAEVLRDWPRLGQPTRRLVGPIEVEP